MALSQMQWNAIATEHGLRCPYCGKFRKLEDFEDQPGHMTVGNGNVVAHVHVGPACNTCRRGNMSRDVPFEPDAVCDVCGKPGANDLMGDCLCPECLVYVQTRELKANVEDKKTLRKRKKKAAWTAW